jgi:hypothetical protein
MNGKHARENGTMPLSIIREVSEVVRGANFGALAVLVDAPERVVLDLVLIGHESRVVLDDVNQVLGASHGAYHAH